MSVRKLVFLLFLVLNISSCYTVNDDEIVIPEKLLTKTEMIEIISDVQIIEAGFSLNKYRLIQKKLKPEIYNKTLEKHAVTLQEFKDNIDYYNNYPKIMEDIYEQVLENLSKVQNDIIIEKEIIEEQKIADSIAKTFDSIIIVNKDSTVISVVKE